MHLNLRKVLPLTLFCLSFSVFADQSNHFFEQDQLLELVNSNDESILSIEQNGDVYLNPRHLSITEQGVYLRIGNDRSLKIPVLVSNKNGLCAPTVLAAVYPIIKCKSCGKSFNPNFFNKGQCPSCGAQN